MSDVRLYSRTGYGMRLRYVIIIITQKKKYWLFKWLIESLEFTSMIR